MRVAFAGTPPFAAHALRALAAAGHDIVHVLTQPDRPAGRGLRLSPSAVSIVADELRAPLAKPPSLREAVAQQALRQANPEVLVVAAYGLLLPPEVLAIPPHGCINIHASLLPRWRGAAPIQRAILAGDAHTGISIMQMDAGLDTGPVLLQESIAIDPHATAGALTEALARLGARLVVTAVGSLDRLVARAQDPALATLAPKIAKHERIIDWRQDSDRIDRMIRAYNPSPGAETHLAGEVVKIWEANALEGEGPPGEIMEISAGGVRVACGTGVIELRRVQRAGGKAMAAIDFARGIRLAKGMVLGDPAPAR